MNMLCAKDPSKVPYLLQKNCLSNPVVRNQVEKKHYLNMCQLYSEKTGGINFNFHGESRICPKKSIKSKFPSVLEI